MRKLFAISLSVLLLLSSTGVTYAEHFCGSFKMMAKVTVGHEALHCGMTLVASDCDTEDFKAMDCCDNHYLAVTTDDTFAKAQFNFDFTPIAVQYALTSFKVLDLTFHAQKPEAIPFYRPPPNIKNIPLVFQQFLI